MSDALERVTRAAAGRIVAALAARFRDLDLAEEGFADACEAAVRDWPGGEPPNNPAAWLYRVAQRKVLDALRRRSVRDRLDPGAPDEDAIPEDSISHDERVIPDERLRLIFVCCHPAIATEARAALTLRLICGLSSREIADAFLIAEPALLQRLTRAKRKIADAGVPFEIPGPSMWAERLEAVLSTLEIAYARAHADAAGAGPHAGFAVEMLALTATLATMLPEEGEVLGFAALVRYAEARRPARLDSGGAMVPLAEQDPSLWRRDLIADADGYIHRARNVGGRGPRALNAAIHGVWCGRRTVAEEPPWSTVLALYDAMLSERDDVVVRLNRSVAVAEVQGPTDGILGGRRARARPSRGVPTLACGARRPPSPSRSAR